MTYEEDGERITGNNGFLDQQLALSWVQNNIANFGGDKSLVRHAYGKHRTDLQLLFFTKIKNYRGEISGVEFNH